MSKAIIWVVAIVIIIAGIFVLVSDNETEVADTNMVDQNMPTNEEFTDDDSMMVSDEFDSELQTGDVVSFKVEGSNFKFSEDEINVKVGDVVEIQFVNVGGFHDWVIDEFDAKTSQIQSGETETIRFIADKAGSFEYYCSVGNHRAQGMFGTLNVTE